MGVPVENRMVNMTKVFSVAVVVDDFGEMFPRLQYTSVLLCALK